MLRCWSSNKWTCINQCPWLVSLLLLIYLYMTLLKKLWLFRKKLLRVCLHVTLFSTFQQHPSDIQVSTCWKLYYLMEVSERKIIKKNIPALSDRNSITYWNWVLHLSLSVWFILENSALINSISKRNIICFIFTIHKIFD